MKVSIFAKIFFACLLLSLIYLLSVMFKSETDYDTIITKQQLLRQNTKFILQWTLPDTIPFVEMGIGQSTFIDRHCSEYKCYVTSDKNFLGDYTLFDLIAMHGPELVRLNGKTDSLPQRRSPHQKYVFASIESADNYPVCTHWYNGYFNWTWTYKLNSDAVWGYLFIRDMNGNIIGPKTDMHWIKKDDMDPVTPEFKNVLKVKTKAAAWFVSNCKPRNNRSEFVNELKKELHKYGLTVDIYGNCGTLKCSVDNKEDCNKLVKENYYFYLSFENTFSEDYVTEKLLIALQNDAVPIVYGGANYTRFMPDGIYLNARELGPKNLAAKMNHLINDLEEYSNYFRWKNHYTFHNRSEYNGSDDLCAFCSMLHDKELLNKPTVYVDFEKWWNPPKRCLQP